MKKIPLILILVFLLSSLCACSVRDRAEAENPADPSRPAAPSEKEERKQEKPGKKPSKTDTPATGTDLLIPEPLSEAASAALAAVRTEAAANGDVCAIAFLGYADPERNIAESLAAENIFAGNPTCAAYPFLPELTPMNCHGEGFSELLCLVPAGEGYTLRLEEAELEAGEPTDRLTELWSGAFSEPILFTADSNGWGGSNLIVTVTDASGSALRFNPGLLANLGSMNPVERVLDFTVYPES